MHELAAKEKNPMSPAKTLFSGKRRQRLSVLFPAKRPSIARYEL
jgi:hypothetical protein